MKRGVLYLIISVLFTSCAFYKPARVNTPLLQEKGDGHIAATSAFGTSVNASYSPLKNVVLIGSYYTYFDETVYQVDPNTGNKTELFSYDSDQYEVGAGYYNPNLIKNMYFDIIGGYGFGKAGTAINLGFFNINIAGYEAKFHNYFLQSSIGTNLDNNVIFSFGAKANFLNFYDYKSTDNLVGYRDTTYFAVKSKVLVQPFFTLRYSPGLIGLETYMGFGIADNSDYFTHTNFDFGLGLHIDINKLNAWIRKGKIK